MFSSQQSSYICKRVLAGYTQEWQFGVWHHFTPLAILHCPHLRRMVRNTLKTMHRCKRIKDDPDAWRGYNGDAFDHGAEWIAQRFAKYLHVRRAWNTDPCFHRIPSVADVSHSALLSWLIRGREPTPAPPPILFSHPNHRLATGEAVEVSVEEGYIPSERDPKLIISQNYYEFLWHDRGQGLIVHQPTRHYYQLQGQILQKVRLDQRI